MVRVNGADLLEACPGIRVPHPESLVFKPLTVNEHRACCTLEEMAFTNPDHRATAEKFSYRLSECSDISYGLFLRPEADVGPDSIVSKLSGDQLSALTTEDKAGKLVLIAHVVSTRGSGPVVTDNDMAYPKNWRDLGAAKDLPLGHQEDGRTVCLHSLALIPQAQGRQLGKLTVLSYLRVMDDLKMCDRVALICQDELLRFYTMCSFGHVGESVAEFGGGGWHDMAVQLPNATAAKSLRA